eukprot:IDg18269t1
MEQTPRQTALSSPTEQTPHHSTSLSSSSTEQAPHRTAPLRSPATEQTTSLLTPSIQQVPIESTGAASERSEVQQDHPGSAALPHAMRADAVHPVHEMGGMVPDSSAAHPQTRTAAPSQAPNGRGGATRCTNANSRRGAGGTRGRSRNSRSRAVGAGATPRARAAAGGTTPRPRAVAGGTTPRPRAGGAGTSPRPRQRTLVWSGKLWVCGRVEELK